MVKNSCMLISLLLLLQNSVTLGLNTVNVDNINSVYNYFDKIATKAINNYRIDSQLTAKVNKKILNLIFHDKNKVFNELGNISMNLNYYHANKDWKHVMRLIGRHKYQEIEMFDSYDLFSLENELSGLHSRIKAAINAFKFIGRLNDFDNVEYFCTNVYPVANFFLEPLHRESMSKMYTKFIRMIRNLITAIKEKNQKSSRNIAVLLKPSLHDYYQLMMMMHIKLIALKFFNSLTEQRCRNEGHRINGLYDSYWPRYAYKETKLMMDETLKTLECINCYLNDCETGPKDQGDIELKRWMQKIVVKESSSTLTGFCNHNCDLKLMSDEEINRGECKEYRDCQYIAGNIEMCQLNNDVSRYGWLKHSNATVYGNNETCHGNITILNGEYVSMDRNYCGYCLCTCVSKQLHSPFVTTAISFRDQVSDITNDMVVTGVRFFEKDYMIHVQIMEGKVIKKGRGHFNRWKPIENFDFDQNTEMFYVENEFNWLTPLSLGVDYAHPEVMNLDEVVSPAGYVITGVRFRFTNDSIENPRPIELQIRVTPFDSVQSKLFDLDQTRWISPQSSRNGSDQLTKPLINNPDSQDDKIIKFGTSDLWNNAGQSTVPFFDGRTVQSKDFSPIKSLGISYRTSENYFGRLAFQLFSIKPPRKHEKVPDVAE